MKNTRKSLITSTVCLLLCVSMFVGSTFAWFTDSVTSGVNQIVAGNLDVELYHKNVSITGDGERVDGATSLFKGVGGKDMLWEPGAMSYEVFTVKNVGSLALKYNMSMNIGGYNTVVLADDTKTNNNLTEVLKVLVLTGNEIIDEPTRENVAEAFENSNANDIKTLADFSKSGGKLYPENNKPTDGISEEEFQVLVYWEPTDSDNTWNLQNGKYASDATEGEIGYLWVDFGINLVATQLEYEADSFDNTYDKGLDISWPLVGTKDSAIVDSEDISGDVTLTTSLGSVTVPNANLPEEDDYKLRLDIERIANDEVNPEHAVTVEAGNTLATYDVSLVKVVGEEVTKMSASEHVYTVTLFVGKFNDVVKFYHKGSSIANYSYDVNTGYVTFKTNSFSPYATEYMFAGGVGDEEHPYLIENLDNFLAIKKLMVEDYYYFKMINDIDATDRDWVSLGSGHYDVLPGGSIQLVLEESEYLCGSFDGNDHTFKYKFDSSSADYSNQSATFNDVSLFGILWDAEVHDLIIDVNINITDKGVAGAGLAYQAFGEFYNITVNGSINATSSSAGIVYAAQMSWMENCINNADVKVTYMKPQAGASGDAYVIVGGIAGDVSSGYKGYENYDYYDATFIDCVNNGDLENITITDRQPRSIMGAIYGQAINGTVRPVVVENCVNNGTITGYEASNVSPNAYAYPMFEGSKVSGGTTYDGSPNSLKQLTGGYSAKGVIVDDVLYNNTTNNTGLSADNAGRIMFIPGSN